LNLVGMEDGYVTPPNQPIGNNQFLTPDQQQHLNVNIPATPQPVNFAILNPHHNVNIITPKPIRRSLLAEFNRIAEENNQQQT